MKKIINWIKDHTTITAIAILLLTQAIFHIFDIVWVSYISMLAFAWMMIVILFGVFHALSNMYKQGDENTARVLRVVAVLFFAFIFYLVIKFIILP